MTIYNIKYERNGVSDALSDFQKGHPLGLVGKDLEGRLTLVRVFRKALQQVQGSRSRTLISLEKDAEDYETYLRDLQFRYAHPDYNPPALSRFDRANLRKREDSSLSIGHLRNQIRNIEKRLGIPQNSPIISARHSVSSHSPTEPTLPGSLLSSNSSIASTTKIKTVSLWQRFVNWLFEDARVVLPVHKHEIIQLPLPKFVEVPVASVEVPVAINPKDTWLKQHGIDRERLYTLLRGIDYSVVGQGAIDSSYQDFLDGKQALSREIMQYFHQPDAFIEQLHTANARREECEQIREDIAAHKELLTSLKILQEQNNAGIVSPEVEKTLLGIRQLKNTILLLQSKLQTRQTQQQEDNAYLEAGQRLRLAYFLNPSS